MGQRKVQLVEGEYYHIYNRGNSKQDIFRSSSDYTRFQELLFVSNGHNRFVFRDVQDDVYIFDRGEPMVAIAAYCLMPNHFHLLIKPLFPGGAQAFMQKLSTAYSMYFNKRHNRTGALFEGRFRSEHVGEDVYLKYLYAYVHLNPTKLIQPDWKEQGIKDLSVTKEYLLHYQYSSLLDYVKPGLRSGSAILNTAEFPVYFSTANDWMNEIVEWLSYRNVT